VNLRIVHRPEAMEFQAFFIKLASFVHLEVRLVTNDMVNKLDTNGGPLKDERKWT
jgi:hypothetical protein